MNEPLDLAIDTAGIARLTINRPRRANSFDPHLADAMLAALDRLAADESIRVVVLLGNGHSFCAGVDLNWMKASGGASVESNYRDSMKLASILNRLNTLPMPAVAAVAGPAIGLGVGLVACADVAIAAESATFRFSEVRLGILPATVSPYVMAAMGSRACRRYFLTGEAFDAHEARRLGLVHEVCGLDDLGARAAEIVSDILVGKKEAQRAAKRLPADFRLAPIDPALMEQTARRLAELRAGAEAQAALAEFLADQGS